MCFVPLSSVWHEGKVAGYTPPIWVIPKGETDLLPTYTSVFSVATLEH